jgi:hypothetical protein
MSRLLTIHTEVVLRPSVYSSRYLIDMIRDSPLIPHFLFRSWLMALRDIKNIKYLGLRRCFVKKTVSLSELMI